MRCCKCLWIVHFRLIVTRLVSAKVECDRKLLRHSHSAIALPASSDNSLMWKDLFINAENFYFVFEKDINIIARNSASLEYEGKKQKENFFQLFVFIFLDGMNVGNPGATSAPPGYIRHAAIWGLQQLGAVRSLFSPKKYTLIDNQKRSYFCFRISIFVFFCLPFLFCFVCECLNQFGHFSSTTISSFVVDFDFDPLKSWLSFRRTLFCFL